MSSASLGLESGLWMNFIDSFSLFSSFRTFLIELLSISMSQLIYEWVGFTIFFIG